MSTLKRRNLSRSMKLIFLLKTVYMKEYFLRSGIFILLSFGLSFKALSEKDIIIPTV